MEIALQWKMECHNVSPRFGLHQTEIPSPRHLELRADQRQLERERIEMLFACPQCGHVSRYKGSEALCHTIVLEAGQDKPLDVYPLCIVLPCVVESCVARTEVRTTRYASETPDQVIERLSRADFHNVTCSKGDALSFPDDGVLAFEGLDARPF